MRHCCRRLSEGTSASSRDVLGLLVVIQSVVRVGEAGADRGASWHLHKVLDTHSRVGGCECLFDDLDYLGIPMKRFSNFSLFRRMQLREPSVMGNVHGSQ